jgi:hypothetical protein
MKSFSYLALASLSTATVLPRGDSYTFSLEGEGFGPINEAADGSWSLTKGTGYGSSYFTLSGGNLVDSKGQGCYQDTEDYQVQCDSDYCGEYLEFAIVLKALINRR